VGTQFTDAFDIALRVHSLRRFRQWEEAGLTFHRIGYLRLARTPRQIALFARSVALQAEAGLAARLCDTADMKRLVPHMATEGLAGSIFGPGNGFLDPHEMCMLLASMVRAKGGQV